MHPLTQQVGSVGRRARRLLFWRGAARWLGSWLLVVLACAGADYWFRFQEPVLRWMSSGVALAACGWGFRRWVWPAWQFAQTHEVVAYGIEQRFPELRECLSTAMALLRESADDASRLHSPELREAVVREAELAVAGRNLFDCLDNRPARRAGYGLLAMLGLLVLAFLADEPSASLAVKRLAKPWSRDRWPRRNQLFFTVGPTKLPAGQDFAVELTDQRGRLPSEVTIWYWFDGDDASQARGHRMVYAGGRMRHSLPQVARSFRYRAEGGDDQSMEWIPLEVIVSPRLAGTEIRLQPPAYSGLPSLASDQTIFGLAGTSVEIDGRVDQPIATARLEFLAGSTRHEIPAAVAPDGLTFRLPVDSAAPWRLSESGSYRWVLTDRNELSVPVTGPAAVDVLADAPPTVTVESPLPDASFTPTGIVSLRVIVKDDLAIQRVVVRGAGAERVIDERAAPPVAEVPIWPPRGEQRVVPHELELSGVSDAVPGRSVVVRVVASDFKPQDSAPVEIALQIITPDEWKKRANQRQSEILARLQESLRLQRTVRTQTLPLRAPWSGRESLGERASALPGIELGQQRVRSYVDGDGGALSAVERLLAEHTSNRIDDLQLAGHLADFRKGLRDLLEQELRPTEVRLRQASELARSARPASAPDGTLPTAEEATQFVAAAAAAVAGQERVIQALEALVDRLGQWSGYRLLAEDIRHIQVEQQELQRATGALPTAARDVLQLTDAERSALGELGERQSRLAADMDRLQQRLEVMRAHLGEGNPLAGATMDEALERMRDLGVASEMREAARQVEQNRLGVAAAAQDRILDGLAQLHAALSDSTARDNRRITDDLRQATQEVAGLLDLQARTADEAAAAGALPEDQRGEALDKVAGKEQAIAEGVEELSRRMDRIARSNLARELHAAASRVRDAAESAAAHDGPAASAMSRDAARMLADVHRQLAADAGEEAPSVAPLDVAELRILHARQLEINRRTGQLSASRGEGNPLTPDQERELEGLATEQLQIAESVERLMAEIERREE